MGEPDAAETPPGEMLGEFNLPVFGNVSRRERAAQSGDE